MSDEKKTELVTVTIDGKEVQVPKGMNLMQVAKDAGIDIPHYCYHPHLSIAGNCRMCQVEINGSPKLGIACNTTATDGLKVRTHFSCKEVEAAQKATLEFLLINHPLDCTVCDQAGHCKLQDYHYEYNSNASRFVEDKVHKVKAEVLGPEVIYDGERCIMCTRCVRFCEEVTETSELGGFNRGDKGYIGVAEGTELNNALSGTVVDLCPVGALTHRQWRFNTRIWYTREVDSICPGCSTGCNVKAAVRDEQIVQVKARLNSDVNKEWLCDEGRYGFHRFQPRDRLLTPLLRKNETTLEQALAESTKLKGSTSMQDSAVFISPFLTLEEVWTALDFAEKVMGVNLSSERFAMQLRERDLSNVEKILVSPDYAPNARAMTLFDSSLDSTSWRSQIAGRYQKLLNQVKSGTIKRILIVGQDAILSEDVDAKLSNALEAAESLAIVPDALIENKTAAHNFCKIVLPGLTVHEKSGIFVNKDLRLQRIRTLIDSPVGVLETWKLLNKLAKACGVTLLSAGAGDERSLFNEMSKHLPVVKDVSLFKLGELGMNLGDGQHG